MRLPRALALAAVFTACGGGDGTPPLPTSGGSCVMQELSVPNEGWTHVAEGSAVSYAHNPPASGPHYPVWARYEAFPSAIGRGYWVHNVEHGAAVLLYRPDATSGVQQALRDAYAAMPDDPACGHRRALLTPDPLLDREVAVVAADFVLLGDCVDQAAVREFVVARRGSGPENVCANGTRP